MKLSELNKAKYWFATQLYDDETSRGGIAHECETLQEFLESCCDGNIEEMDMKNVNITLKECGIKPIDYQLKKERKQFAVMIGMYFRGYSDDDTLRTITDIIEFADNYDFEMREEYGDWVIDTELAREAAMDFAEQLSIAL